MILCLGHWVPWSLWKNTWSWKIFGLRCLGERVVMEQSIIYLGRWWKEGHRHVLCGHGRKSCSCWGWSSLKTSSEPSRPSLMPCTMHLISPDGLDVYIPFSYHVSAAFLPICILFSLHSALAKLVGAKLPQWAVYLPALHLSSGCQLQFWS